MAHRYRQYPTPQQKRVFEMHGSHARLVWNAALEQRSWWRPGRDSPPGHYECIRQLAEARAELGWLAAGSSSVQQVALRDLDRALRSWWAGTHRRPRWRKRGRRDGFC